MHDTDVLFILEFLKKSWSVELKPNIALITTVTHFLLKKMMNIPKEGL